MVKLISPKQYALFKGRMLVDGIVVVNGVINQEKRSKKEYFIFKVVFEKAYKSVSWSFQDYMLMIFGFSFKWISWIIVCFFFGNLAVLVNGSPTPEIKIQRGLKQGAPLIPSLFSLWVKV